MLLHFPFQQVCIFVIGNVLFSFSDVLQTLNLVSLRRDAQKNNKILPLPLNVEPLWLGVFFAFWVFKVTFI